MSPRRTDTDFNKSHFRDSLVPEESDRIDVGIEGNRWDTVRCRRLLADVFEVLVATFASLVVGTFTATTSLILSYLVGPGYLKIDSSEVVGVQAVPIPVTDGGTNAITAAAAATSLGVGTGDSPLFTAVNVGATDTTVSRAGAGDIAVEGNTVYRVGGTDVAIADGGTGSSTAATARTALGSTTVGDAVFIAASAAAGRTALDVPSNAEAILDTLVDAKGDLIAATAADTVARLAAGANDTFLVAASGETTGLKYATPLSRHRMTLQDAGAITAVGTWTLGTWAASSTELIYTRQYMTRAGVIRNLYAVVAVAPGGSDTAIFTVRKNAADQAVTCTITGAAVSASDLTNSFTFAAGDYITLKVVLSATAASRLLTTALEVEYSTV